MANHGKTAGTARRKFGEIETRPSGRFRARYVGPDNRRHPRTFDVHGDAEEWLNKERVLMDRDEWTPPEWRAATVHETVASYAETQLGSRELAPRTREEYDRYLERFVTEDDLGKMPIGQVSPADVKVWLALVRATTGKVMAARVYALVSSIFKAAVADDVIPASPFRVKNASQAKRQRPKTDATVEEVAAVLAHLPERYRVMVLVAAWGGLRSGELRNLRRQDVDLKAGTVTARQQVQNLRKRGKVVRDLKSDAAARTLHLPTHVAQALREHVKKRSQEDGWGRDGLVFPSTVGTPISQSRLWAAWDKARRAIDRPDLRFHDLRHTAANLAARTGATVPELMDRLGHSTPQAAMAYLHAAKDADQRIATGLDAAYAAATPTPKAKKGAS